LAQQPEAKANDGGSRERKKQTAQAADANDEVQRLQEEVKRLRADVEELRKALAPVKERLDKQQPLTRKGEDSDAKFVVKVYSLVGLTDGAQPEEAESLLGIIVKTVEPTSWLTEGGEGSIQYAPTASSIIVRQTPDNQKQVQDLLDALRKNRADQGKAEREKLDK
jgi:hypothetical protein